MKVYKKLSCEKMNTCGMITNFSGRPQKIIIHSNRWWPQEFGSKKRECHDCNWLMICDTGCESHCLSCCAEMGFLVNGEWDIRAMNAYADHNLEEYRKISDNNRIYPAGWTDEDDNDDLEFSGRRFVDGRDKDEKKKENRKIGEAKKERELKKLERKHE